MKKCLKQLMIVLMVIMVLPLFVMAKTTESKIASVKEDIREFKVDKIILTDVSYTRFFNYANTGKTAVIVNAKVSNDYVKDIELSIEANFYNKSRKLLDTQIEVVKVPAKGTANYRKIVYGTTVNYKLESIEYYSLSADIITNVDLLAESEKDLLIYHDYNLKVKVNKNNVYNVEESFNVEFKRHVVPIVDGIQYRLQYTREDGSKVNKRALMSNIKANHEYYLKTEDGYRNLYIGKEDKETNRRDYVINYDYNVFEDTISKKDEFVFYILNHKPNKIDGMKFEIEFPEDVSKQEIVFVDQHGTKLENIDYEVKDNKVIGKIDQMINSDIAYAIRVSFDDGYFKDASKGISDMTLLSLIVTIVGLAFTVIIWYAQRLRDRKVKYDSIYFNDKLNSLELGYLYNGVVKDKDIATLLIALANKGYIKIDKTKKNYKIVKVKEYDSDDRLEKVFMSELFLSGKEVDRKDLITNVDYMKKNIEFKLKAHKKKNRLFIMPVLNYKLIFWIITSIIFALITTNIFLEYHTSVIAVNIIVGLIGYVVLLYGILYENSKIERVIYTFVGIMFVVAPIVLTKYLAFIQDPLNLVTYIIGIVSMLVIITITRMMNNRTFYGIRMYNKINAYKNYLSEFDEQEKELKKNKNCFYDVLANTFVLGISDKWYHKFSDLKIDKPKWYITDNFTLEEFYKDIKDIYADIFISLKNSEK